MTDPGQTPAPVRPARAAPGRQAAAPGGCDGQGRRRHGLRRRLLACRSMLHAKVFRSTQAIGAHRPAGREQGAGAAGRRLRADRGATCPNARLVTDMPGQTGQKQRAGSDVPVLAIGPACASIGEPIALVAAETLDIAEQALRLIEIEYEPLPGVFDPLEALKPGAPDRCRPAATTWSARWKIRKGDLRGGLRRGRPGRREHLPRALPGARLPGAGSRAWPGSTSGACINIRVSHPGGRALPQHRPGRRRAAEQDPHPGHHGRRRLRRQGGHHRRDLPGAAGQGHRSGPVRLVYTREESILAHSKRHPYVITHRTGVKRDGRITASQIKHRLRLGRVPVPQPLRAALHRRDGARPLPDRQRARRRGRGGDQQPVHQRVPRLRRPAGLLRLRAADGRHRRRAGHGPLELRRRQLPAHGRHHRHRPGRSRPRPGWRRRPRARWRRWARRRREPLGGRINVAIGQGFASYFQSYGRITWLHDTSQAWVGVELDGTVVVRAGVPDLGAGQINSLCQIAAEVLGVPLERVSVYTTDSALTPLSGTSTATRQLYMSGNATLQAANAVRKVLLERASQYFEEEPDSARPGRRQGLRQERPGAGAGAEPTWRRCAPAKGCPWPTWRCSRRRSPTRSTRRPARATSSPTSPSAPRRSRWRSTPRPARSPCSRRRLPRRRPRDQPGRGRRARSPAAGCRAWATP